MPEKRFSILPQLAQSSDSFVAHVRGMLNVATLVSALKNLAWLLPLTLLIWFYAESNSRDSATGFKARIRIRTSDPSRIVQVMDPADGLVTLSLVGPKARIEQLDSLSRVSGLEVELAVPDLRNSGEVYLPLLDLIRDAAVFKNPLVYVQAVSPAQARLNVDEFIEKQLPVRVPDSIAANLNSAVFDPPTVTVRAPAAAMKAAESAGKLYVEADLGGLPDLKTAGPKEPRQVQVRSALGDAATLQPATVTATLDVRQTDIELTLKSVPVFASLPPSISDAWRLTVQPDPIFNVRVLGPADQIAMLSDNKFSAKARLEFSTEELQGAQAAPGRLFSKRPVLVLPEGVRSDKSEADRTVEWSLQRRDTGG